MKNVLKNIIRSHTTARQCDIGGYGMTYNIGPAAAQMELILVVKGIKQ